VLMGSYAEAFGYTPDQFYQLTLPQIAAFGRYIEERDKELDSAKSSSPSRKSKSEKPVSSVENLVAVFGDDETKRRLLSDG
jgi:hypothetical protein